MHESVLDNQWKSHWSQNQKYGVAKKVVYFQNKKEIVKTDLKLEDIEVIMKIFNIIN